MPLLPVPDRSTRLRAVRAWKVSCPTRPPTRTRPWGRATADLSTAPAVAESGRRAADCSEATPSLYMRGEHLLERMYRRVRPSPLPRRGPSVGLEVQSLSRPSVLAGPAAGGLIVFCQSTRGGPAACSTGPLNRTCAAPSAESLRVSLIQLPAPRPRPSHTSVPVLLIILSIH